MLEVGEGHHGGLKEVAGAVNDTASGEQHSALLLERREKSHHAVTLLGRNHRSYNNAGVEAVAHLELLGLGHKLLGELLGNRAVQNDPVGRHTRLSGIAELADDGLVHGEIDVGVVQNNERSVTAEFHGGIDDVLGCLREQRGAYPG